MWLNCNAINLLWQCASNYANQSSDVSGNHTKLSKILLNGNNICMVLYCPTFHDQVAKHSAVNTWWWRPGNRLMGVDCGGETVCNWLIGLLPLEFFSDALNRAWYESNFHEFFGSHMSWFLFRHVKHTSRVFFQTHNTDVSSMRSTKEICCRDLSFYLSVQFS